MALFPEALFHAVLLDPVVALEDQSDKMVGKRDREDHRTEKHDRLRDPKLGTVLTL